MDPVTLSVVFAVSCSSAFATWIGVRRRAKAQHRERDASSRAGTTEPTAARIPGDASSWARVGEVLTYLNEAYWLSGELLLLREGAPVVRMFLAPERGQDRWIGIPRDGRTVWVLREDRALGAIGWPGVEISTRDGSLRRSEHGSVALAVSGELSPGWEGVGRFAIFQSIENIALFVEGPARERLALLGRAIPKSLVEKVG